MNVEGSSTSTPPVQHAARTPRAETPPEDKITSVGSSSTPAVSKDLAARIQKGTAMEMTRTPRHSTAEERPAPQVQMTEAEAARRALDQRLIDKAQAFDQVREPDRDAALRFFKGLARVGG